jgi:hypothetical protein
MKILKNFFLYYIIISYFFPAPLRFLFSFILGADILSYSLSIFLVLAMFVFKRKQILNAINEYSWVFAYLILLAIYSAAFESLIMISFLFYMFIPFFFYILYQKEILNFINTSDKLLIVLLILSSVGIIYDYYFDFPWKALSFNVDGKDVEFAKNWSADGVERVAGFYRSSEAAAIGTLLLAILIIYNSKNIIFHHLVFALAFISVYITTTKGCLVSVILVYMVYLSQFINKNFAKAAIFSLISVLCIAIVILPLGLLQDVQVPFLNNSSLLDRINNEWPLLMNHFKSFTDYVLGLGIGAVGVPQKIYGNENIFSPADNFFIYMYGNFGIAVLIIFKLVFSRLKKINNQLFLYMTVFLFSYGVTTNIAEAPLGQLMIAISLCMSFNKPFEQVEESYEQIEETDISTNDYHYDLHKL